MHRRTLLIFSRLLLRLVACAAALGLAALSVSYVGIAGLLYMRGRRDLRLGPELISFWPDWLPALDIYGRAAPIYLVGGVAAFLVALPLTYAVLEKLYLGLLPEAAEEDEAPADAKSSGAATS